MNQAIIPIAYPIVTETEAGMTRSERLERVSLLQRYSMQGHPVQRYPMQRYPVQECSVQRYINLSMNERPNFFLSRPLVRAAGLLNTNSTTEIIDVNTLPQRNTSIIREREKERNVCSKIYKIFKKCILQFTSIFQKNFFISTYFTKIIKTLKKYYNGMILSEKFIEFLSSIK